MLSAAGPRVATSDGSASIDDRDHQHGEAVGVVQVVFDRGEDADGHVPPDVLAAEAGEDGDGPPVAVGPDAGVDDLELDAVADGVEVASDRPDDGRLGDPLLLVYGGASNGGRTVMVARSRGRRSGRP